MDTRTMVELAKRLADELSDGGEYFDVAGKVVYGWVVGGRSYPPTEDAAELLMVMAAEIERLLDAREEPPVTENGDESTPYPQPAR